MVLIAATPGSLFAIGWLRSLSQGFLLDSLNQLRKKLFSKGVYFNLVFTSTELERIQKDHIAPPLRPPPAVRPLVSLPRPAWLFLVGCCAY